MSAQNAPSFRLRDLPRVPDKTIKYFLLKLEMFFDKVAETIGARPIMWGMLIVLFHYLVAGTFFAYIEGRTPFDSIYWANTTLTTVGYGDMYPHHSLTKLEAMETQWSGIIAAALVVTVLIQKVMQARESDLNETPELSDDLGASVNRIRKLHDELGAEISQFEEIQQQLSHRERLEALGA